MPLSLDAFVPAPDVQERFEATIRAPRHVVMAVATGFDMQSQSIVRAIFWMRERFMGAAPREPRPPRGLLDDMRALGWGLLLERPGELVIGGAASRRRFLAYWRWARFGIIAIRWVLLPAIRREAERQWASR
jgi:hypothetical protein